MPTGSFQRQPDKSLQWSHTLLSYGTRFDISYRSTGKLRAIIVPWVSTDEEYWGLVVDR